MSVPSVASSIVAGNTRRMSAITGLVVSTELPKSPVQDAFDIDEELLIERQVEAHLLARRARRHALRRAVAEIASTGSIGTTRPMKKVTARRPR